MNLLKTPHQRILEEAGASPFPSPGMLNTPKQMLFQESGLLPKFSDGGRLYKAEQNLTPEQMQAALIVGSDNPPKFEYATGGDVIASESLPIHPYLEILLKQTGAIK